MKIIKKTFLSLLFCAMSLNAHAKYKNVILFIGDGMGPQQVFFALDYHKTLQPLEKKTALDFLFKNAEVSSVITSSYADIVTDSTAAATAMACGFKTYNAMMGIDPEGNKCNSLGEIANKKQKSVGIVSNTRIGHATPGPFLVENMDRGNENEIGEDVINLKYPQVLLNGGGRHIIPKGTKLSDIKECKGLDPLADGKSKRSDSKNLIQKAKHSGYNFVCTKDQLKNFKAEKGKRLLGIFSSSTFPLIQEREKSKTVPSLKLMTQKAIEVLSQNKNGFFLMVEGGLIDYAGHFNDPGTIVKETLDFDKAIAVGLDYAKSHPDTLVIVTSDHETGGFGFSYRHYLEGEKAKIRNVGTQTYQDMYSRAPRKDTYALLAAQNKSLSQMLFEVQDEIYGKKHNHHQAQTLLKNKITQSTQYKVSDKEADISVKKLVPQKPGDKNFYDPYPFTGNNPLPISNSIRLSKIIGPQTHTTWSTATHTAVPVYIFVYSGDEKKKVQIPNLIDNTDVYKLIAKEL